MNAPILTGLARFFNSARESKTSRNGASLLCARRLPVSGFSPGRYSLV